MPEIVIINIIIIFCATLLGAMLGAGSREAGWGAWAGFAISLNLSILAWVIFVAQHFIGKYW